MRREILLTQKELGYRLKSLEANWMTQEDVSRYLWIERKPQGCIYVILRIYPKLEGYPQCEYERVRRHL